jgi:hypothetical protein
MSLFAGQTREQLRLAYADAWQRHQAGLPLSPLAAQIADVILVHPEYQALVADPTQALAFASAADPGQENPFLHMGLHLAVRDQIATDRPAGIRDLHRALQARAAEAHDAEHRLMEALAEVLWEAQRQNQAPDELRYLALASRALRPVPGAG